MATAPHSPPDPRYEPKPRYYHCSALVEGKWITYGGVGADGGLADPPTSIHVFDPDKKEWTQMTTSGTPPSTVVSAACAAVGPLLYHIGGLGKGDNAIHCLDTTTTEWRELQPTNPQTAPMKKAALAGISYGSIIVTVGGLGDLRTNRHPGVEYVPHPESEDVGLTNEVVCYDTGQNMWFRPVITGSPPPACSWCSLTRVDHHQAVLFGGTGTNREPISPDVYILDMNHWTWTVIPASQTPNHPVAREGHSSISVYDPDADPTHPALLIMWGGAGGEILRDSWIFHLNQQQWREVILPKTLKGRIYHTSVVIHSSPKIRIICSGGADDWPEDGDDPLPIAQTTMVELSCSGDHPAEWIVTDVSQLGEGDRLPTRIKLTMGSNGGTPQDDDSSIPIEFNESDRKKITIDGRRGKIAVECFEPYSINRAIIPRPVKFSFGVVRPNTTEKFRCISSYDMEQFPHGIALIINNEVFTSKSMRKGTAIDERNLTHIFRYLGYKVEVHRDQKALEMLDIMIEIGTRSHEMYDSFVCCILSHGIEGHVFGIDGEKVSLRALTEKVDARNCLTLRSKPKLFFLQACRGELKEAAVNISTDSGESMPPCSPQLLPHSGAPAIATDSNNEIPSAADFFFGHATPLGYVAWRDEDHGSWFVSELCRSLCEMYRYAPLDNIMNEVRKRVATGKGYKYVGCRVSSESTTHLLQSVFF